MALTLQQIAQINAEDNYKFETFISPENIAFSLSALGKCKIEKIEKLKFENQITDSLTLKDKGIYLFVLEHVLVQTISLNYLLYIGKAYKTNSFKQRFYAYRSAIGSTQSKKNILMLTNLWPNSTFVYFVKITDNQSIEDVEKILINKLRPPFNEEYYTEKSVNSTSLYKIADNG
ncbi:MAG TPA: GIY-YIG nuclease family protein [Candidatus Babeliaceae bacterium]|nr:GIY-YIG nuclease family protein [Candidatus Babeliaceae bacterium]